MVSINTIDIIQASERDISKLADTLAQSFNSDPFFLWMFRQDGKRMEGLRSFFTYSLLAHTDGEAFASKNFEACAIWFPPGGGLLDSSPETSSILESKILEWSTKEKVDRFLKVVEALSQRPIEPHGYLKYIGVKPIYQRQGLGSTLLRHKLGFFNNEDIPVYLENTNLVNNSLYRHFGFKIINTIYMQENAPPVSLMWREPKSKSH